MKRRTKKVLSLILAASLVFTLNTAAFGEEIVAEEAVAGETIVEPAEDVAADDTEVETVAEGVVAESEASDAELEDAELAAADHERNGIVYEDADKTRPLTKISFVSNGKKKNEKFNVAVIENTTNPVSWNNYYAANLIETVFSGEYNKDNVLNNNVETSVSSSSPLHQPDAEIKVDGEKKALEGYSYQTYPVNEADGIYLFVKYGFFLTEEEKETKVNSLYVKGYDAFNEPEYDDLLPYISQSDPSLLDEDDAEMIAARIGKIPITYWDGRKVAWNKNGKGVMSKTSKNILDVEAAIVKYERNTVKEFANVVVKSVKIEKKALKAASVKAKPSQTKISCKYLDTTNAESPKVVATGLYIPEHDVMNTLPTFELTIKTDNNKDLQKYKTDVKEAIKDIKFPFGIVQTAIPVKSPFSDYLGIDYIKSEYFDSWVTTGWNHFEPVFDDDKTVAGSGLDNIFYKQYSQKDSYVIPASSNEIMDDKGEGIQKEITEQLMENGYSIVKEYTDPIPFLNPDQPDQSPFKIGKFKHGGKKASLTLTIDTKTAKGVKRKADVTLKQAKNNSAKGDFTLTKGSLAGKDVFVLDFTENGNYAYMEADPWSEESDFDLSVFGYKYAFRPSPISGSKGYRYGIYADTNQGFVAEAE